MKGAYSAEKCVHEIIEKEIDLMPNPDKVAIKTTYSSLSYKELEKIANQIANYIIEEHRLPNESLVLIFMERNIFLIPTILGILKSGCAYIPLDPSIPKERLKEIIIDSNVKLVISSKNYYKALQILQWDCDSPFTILFPDFNLQEMKKNNEENLCYQKDIWEYIGNKYEKTGWKDSYNNIEFSDQEIEEFTNNVYLKLYPLLSKTKSVLDIGCGSGLVLRKIAPLVKECYGIDFSSSLIKKAKNELQKEGVNNVTLETLHAHELEKLQVRNIDVVILNSVIQYFPNYNYFYHVLKHALKIIDKEGVVFIGDVRSLELKLDFIESLKTHNVNYVDDLDYELFFSQKFFTELKHKFPEISEVTISPKIHKLENEFTQYRFDVLLHISEKRHVLKKEKRIKEKEIHDQNYLSKFTTDRPNLLFSPCNIAYVIFTSGSTGKPKGVIIEHRSIVNFLYAFIEYTQIQESDRLLAQTSISFDISGLEIFLPLLARAEILLISKDEMLDIQLFNEITSEITLLQATPSMWRLIIDSGWKGSKKLKALCGGEPLSYKLAQELLKKTGSLWNVYGPTETTIWSTIHKVKESDQQIYIGKPIKNTKIYILDDNLKLLPHNEKGEIYIGGSGLARGYLNLSNLTAEKFITSPFFTEEKLYKTGDLGCWNSQGVLEIFGRTDSQIKIDGFRIELAEIESTMINYNGIKEVVVCVETKEEKNCLYAYYTSHFSINIKTLKEYLSSFLPDYMLPNFFIQLSKMPYMANGKINRKALRSFNGKQHVDQAIICPCKTLKEKRIAQIFAEILQIDLQKIGTRSSFIELGGRSINVALLLSRINNEYNSHIAFFEFYTNPTIEGLINLLRKTDKQQDNKPIQQKRSYPLTSLQQMFFELEQTKYTLQNHTNILIELKGKINIHRFNHAFNELLCRHDILSASFSKLDHRIIQNRNKLSKVTIAIQDAQSQDINKIVDNFIKPFSLDRAPLFRVGLYRLSSNKFLFLFFIHHIITDALSAEILINDFLKLYDNESLKPLLHSFFDFAQYQNDGIEKGLFQDQAKYWQSKMRHFQETSLPFDLKSKRKERFILSKELKIQDGLLSKVEEFCMEHGILRNIFVISLILQVMAKECSNNNATIELVMMNRGIIWENTVGCFLNSIYINADIGENISLVRYVRKVGESINLARQNLTYPIELIKKQIRESRGLTKDMSTIKVNYILPYDSIRTKSTTKDFSVKRIDQSKSYSRHDFSILVKEDTNAIIISLLYNRTLYSDLRIKKVLDEMNHSLQAL